MQDLSCHCESMHHACDMTNHDRRLIWQDMRTHMQLETSCISAVTVSNMADGEITDTQKLYMRLQSVNPHAKHTHADTS